jgi:hypothetical protein
MGGKARSWESPGEAHCAFQEHPEGGPEGRLHSPYASAPVNLENRISRQPPAQDPESPDLAFWSRSSRRTGRSAGGATLHGLTQLHSGHNRAQRSGGVRLRLSRPGERALAASGGAVRTLGPARPAAHAMNIFSHP